MNHKAVSAGLTADDVASIWRIPKGTVYRYAHMHQWRRYKQIGRVYYHPDDVTTTLDEMHPG
ncbi:helix-turn-helix domain-containing protein [Streptomyces sp. WMMC500]|uniref:helix-turn-helix domain-containing protein n=1 Tax=Streptomyces sp. WMMC500 TaxID=3015154 RepID=UPI00248B5F55|nr:helix-turn-helix domain-containing protein [Streptomyces sp. WMMC500]WBB61004.1 helix-turn-helix domain-containing protein [Streptomyces sp. WMMC500]